MSNVRIVKHSKKRNVGLIYEFLLRTISKSLVENDTKRSGTALRILKKHFKPGTELYRELRLFNSLVKTTVSSDAVASSIIVEAKNATRAIDVDKLEKSKTSMLHEINKLLASSDNAAFFDQPIAEYKTFATIGTLLSAWRSSPGQHDLAKMADYESKLVEWLLSDKAAKVEETSSIESPGVNRLIFKVMTKKLNDKYGDVLSNEQKALVREYALYGVTGTEEAVKAKLQEVKDNVLSAIDTRRAGLPEHTVKKLDEVRDTIVNDTAAKLDDTYISKYMSYLKLTSELETPEDAND